jgi:hypothetical protein
MTALLSTSDYSRAEAQESPVHAPGPLSRRLAFLAGPYSAEVAASSPPAA